MHRTNCLIPSKKPLNVFACGVNVSRNTLIKVDKGSAVDFLYVCHLEMKIDGRLRLHRHFGGVVLNGAQKLVVLQTVLEHDQVVLHSAGEVSLVLAERLINLCLVLQRLKCVLRKSALDLLDQSQRTFDPFRAGQPLEPCLFKQNPQIHLVLVPHLLFFFWLLTNFRLIKVSEILA